MTAGPRGWWQALLSRCRGAARRGEAESARLPRVKRGWRYTELQFTGGVSQSRMRTFRPGHLLIDYTRTMMASLLFQPQPARIGMIGLGGGSQAKFCHRHLPGARLEVAENNPHVLALRRRFRVPDDDARLRVLLACMHGPIAVGDIAARIGASQPLVSHHLRLLRGARLVRGERHQRHVLYSTADGHISHMLTDMLEHAREAD